MREPARTFIALALCGLVAGCAARGKPPQRADIVEALRARGGATIREVAGPAALPPGIAVDDGLTAEEAVAIALWNSPSFEVSLTELGLARADVVEAGLLRNPVLSLLLPWGPKQLEGTLQLPAEVLWQRPRRVALAVASARAVGERLIFEGLRLIADVRQAHADAAGGDVRVQLAEENASLATRIAGIADARLKAGDISELEARAARADAAQLRATHRALEHERALSRIVLLSRMGLELEPAALSLTPVPAVIECPALDVLLDHALAARPDVRAAEMTIEAAGLRAKWERSRVFTLLATLDANAEGKEGVEVGPGLAGELPVLNRNQGGRARAAAELDRAARTYAALRAQVLSDVRTAHVRLEQSRQALTIWSKEIVPELQIEQRQAERAYEAGEAPLLSTLDVGRRLVQARIRAVDAAVELERALIAVERAVGRRCGS